MKKCFKCGIEKELSEYYRHKQMSDGHLNKCKDCTKKDTKKRHSELIKNEEWKESEKKRNREKYYRLGYKEKHRPSYEDKKKAMDKFNKKYPEKIIAKNLSQHIKCEKGFNNHHWSYRKENANDVITLTIKDHNTLHRFLKYNQKEMCYETINCTLLDTRSKHEEYWESIKSLN